MLQSRLTKAACSLAHVELRHTSAVPASEAASTGFVNRLVQSALCGLRAAQECDWWPCGGSTTSNDSSDILDRWRLGCKWYARGSTAAP